MAAQNLQMVYSQEYHQIPANVHFGHQVSRQVSATIPDHMYNSAPVQAVQAADMTRQTLPVPQDYLPPPAPQVPTSLEVVYNENFTNRTRPPNNWQYNATGNLPHSSSRTELLAETCAVQVQTQALETITAAPKVLHHSLSNPATELQVKELQVNQVQIKEDFTRMSSNIYNLYNEVKDVNTLIKEQNGKDPTQLVEAFQHSIEKAKSLDGLRSVHRYLAEEMGVSEMRLDCPEYHNKLRLLEEHERAKADDEKKRAVANSKDSTEVKLALSQSSTNLRKEQAANEQAKKKSIEDHNREINSLKTSHENAKAQREGEHALQMSNLKADLERSKDNLHMELGEQKKKCGRIEETARKAEATCQSLRKDKQDQADQLKKAEAALASKEREVMQKDIEVKKAREEADESFKEIAKHSRAYEEANAVRADKDAMEQRLSTEKDAMEQALRAEIEKLQAQLQAQGQQDNDRFRGQLRAETEEHNKENSNLRSVLQQTQISAKMTSGDYTKVRQAAPQNWQEERNNLVAENATLNGQVKVIKHQNKVLWDFVPSDKQDRVTEAMHAIR